MAHNLSTFDGRITMAYFGETPWHKLGTRLTNDARVNVESAMMTAGLNWTVSAQPVYLSDGRPVVDAQAIVRNEDGVIFGTVGHRFTPIQNSDAFAILSDVIKDAGVTIESAGAIGSGARVWMLCRFAESREITRGDVINPYFLVTMAHDGSGAFVFRLTPIRVVCQNTLTAAMASGRNEMTIRHTSSASARLSEARRMINALSGILDDTVQVYQNLAAFAVSADDVRNVMTLLFPIDADASKEVRTKQMHAQAQVETLRRFGKGAEMTFGSAWGLYNAVTEYVDHVKPAEINRDSTSATRRANAISSAVFGPGDALKVKALAAVRQLVAA